MRGQSPSRAGALDKGSEGDDLTIQPEGSELSCPVIDVFRTSVEAPGPSIRLIQEPWPAVVQDTGAIAPGAIVTLLDHAIGCSIARMTSPVRAATTVELRVDWVGETLAHLPIVVEALQPHLSGHAATADAIATQDGGKRVIALARGQFLRGVQPGGVSADAIAQVRRASCAERDFPSYEAFLDAHEQGWGLAIAPRERFQGFWTIRAYHGGIIAALMDIAARRLAGDAMPGLHRSMRSLTVHYLRPSIATTPLLVTAKHVRKGRSVLTLAAEARCGGPESPVTATGLMTVLGQQVTVA